MKNSQFVSSAVSIPKPVSKFQWDRGLRACANRYNVSIETVWAAWTMAYNYNSWELRDYSVRGFGAATVRKVQKALDLFLSPEL